MSIESEVASLTPGNARNPEYAQQLMDLAARGQCPLDPEVFLNVTPPKDVLSQQAGWILSRAKYPYDNTEQTVAGTVGHMLLFPERHIVSPDEMTPDEQLRFWEMAQLAREFGAATGAIVLRYSTVGRQAAVGATIQHLHAHIVVPHLNEETGRVPGFGTPDARVVKVNIG